MGGAAADPAFRIAIDGGVVEIARDEPGREAQRAGGLHHQQGEVAAGAAVLLQRFGRRLGAGGGPRLVLEAFLDGAGHGDQHVLGFGRPVGADELLGPFIDLVVGIGKVTFGRPAQIGDFIRGVGEGICPRIFLDRKLRIGQAEVIQADFAFEPQLGGGPVEGADRDGVAEDIVHPSDLFRRRTDHHPGIKQPHVVAVPWPEHKPVVSEPDRLGIAVDGHVVDLEDSHGDHPGA